MFLDYDLLLDARPLLEDVFSKFGYGDTDVGTFPSMMRGFMKRLKLIIRLPDDTPQKPGLLRDYVLAVELCFSDVADTHKLILRTKLPHAVRTFYATIATDVEFSAPASAGSQKFLKKMYLHRPEARAGATHELSVTRCQGHVQFVACRFANQLSPW